MHNSNTELQKDNDALRSANDKISKEMDALKSKVAKMEEDLKKKDAEVRYLWLYFVYILSLELPDPAFIVNSTIDSLFLTKKFSVHVYSVYDNV